MSAAGETSMGRSSLAAWLRNRLPRRIPHVQQNTAADCGAACLASVLSYFGKNVSLGEVREFTGTNRDGVNALSLIRAAKWYGLRGRGVALERADVPF